MGHGVRAGHLYRETYITDIAATLAALLKTQVPLGLHRASYHRSLRTRRDFGCPRCLHDAPQIASFLRNNRLTSAPDTPAGIARMLCIGVLIDFLYGGGKSVELY